MKDISEEQWCAERPQGVTAYEAIEYCLRALFEEKKKKAKDTIVPGLDYEILIGTLLLARDTVVEHEECYYRD